MMSALIGKLIYGFFAGLLVGVSAKLAGTQLEVVRRLEAGERSDEQGRKIAEEDVERVKVSRRKLGYFAALFSGVVLLLALAHFPTGGEDAIEAHKREVL